MLSWKDFNIEYGKPLSDCNTWKVGGRVEMFFEPDSIEQLRDFVNLCRETGTIMRVLGGGSNLLIRDTNLSGAVIRIGSSFSSIRSVDGVYTVGGGAKLSGFVNKAAEEGFAGLEPMAGIPGTIGGALMMNAGGKYGVISENLRSVYGIDFEGNDVRLQKHEINFGYRESGLENIIILSADFQLDESPAEAVQARTREVYEEKKASQPLEQKTAGCVFKNTKNVSAGKIIDEIGFKGVSCGDAVVSDMHANFIINKGSASAGDIVELIQRIREHVLVEKNIGLELEIKVW